VLAVGDFEGQFTILEVDELGPAPLDGAQAETQSSPEDEVRPDAGDGTPALASGIPKGVQYGSLNGFREVLALAG